MKSVRYTEPDLGPAQPKIGPARIGMKNVTHRFASRSSPGRSTAIRNPESRITGSNLTTTPPRCQRPPTHQHRRLVFRTATGPSRAVGRSGIRVSGSGHWTRITGTTGRVQVRVRVRGGRCGRRSPARFHPRVIPVRPPRAGHGREPEPRQVPAGRAVLDQHPSTRRAAGGGQRLGRERARVGEPAHDVEATGLGTGVAEHGVEDHHVEAVRVDLGQELAVIGVAHLDPPRGLGREAAQPLAGPGGQRLRGLQRRAPGLPGPAAAAASSASAPSPSGAVEHRVAGDDARRRRGRDPGPGDRPASRRARRGSASGAGRPCPATSACSAPPAESTARAPESTSAASAPTSATTLDSARRPRDT